MQEYVLSLSYGKDSLACLGAIEELGLPLTRIVHAEVWATDTIHADLPPMVEFKSKADKIIKARFGIEVEHVCAMKNGKKVTYQDVFYRKLKPRNQSINQSLRKVYGFPTMFGKWCNSMLKGSVLDKNIRIPIHRERHGVVSRTQTSDSTGFQSHQSEIGVLHSNCNLSTGFSDRAKRGADTNTVIQYLGIAADEPNRFHNLTDKKRSPLVEAGWTESMCRDWCEANDLLSPIYTTSTRGGCWFCHNQSVGQLRNLRKNYPDLWALLLKWDIDSPVSFKPDGRTVHDFDARFAMEDEGLISPDDPWKWGYIADTPLQLKMKF